MDDSMTIGRLMTGFHDRAVRVPRQMLPFRFGVQAAVAPTMSAWRGRTDPTSRAPRWPSRSSDASHPRHLRSTATLPPLRAHVLRHLTRSFPYCRRPLQTQRPAGLQPSTPAFLPVWSPTTRAPPNGSRPTGLVTPTLGCEGMFIPVMHLS